LTRAGIAVLRYDDRGVGASTGNFAEATSLDFASDARAAVDFLAARDEVASDWVGIVGHSEGGLVGPLSAGASDQVSWLVLLAGPSISGLEVLVEQGRLINEAAATPPALTLFNQNLQRALARVVAGTEPESAEPELRKAIQAEIDAVPAEERELVEAVMTEEAVEQTVAQMNSPWFRFFLDYDPLPALKATRVPVLALLGELDLQVPPSINLEAFREAFGADGNPNGSVRVLPGLNHLFQLAETGVPSEYWTIEETMDLTAIEVVSEWILEGFRAAVPVG